MPDPIAGDVLADLSVFQTDSPDPVAPGSNITYAISLSNPPAAMSATNVVVNDVVPAGTTFVSASAPPMSAWAVTPPPVGGTGTVSFTHPSVPPFQTHHFTIVVQVGAGVPGGTVITNTVTASTTSAEQTLANNTATVTTSVAVVATPAPTPAASLADAATSQPASGNPLTILGFAVLLVSALAVLVVRRVRT